MLNDKHAQTADDAFRTLFETYKSRLYGYTLSLTHSAYIAEEITQEIFIKLWLCREQLAEIENIDGYIFAMARNKILNHIRKAANDKKLMAKLLQAMVAENNNVEEYVMAADYNKSINEALGMLSSQPRLVYQLSRQQGLNHEEIAETLHLSRNTVKNHLVTALRIIRKSIEKNASSIILFLSCLLVK